LTTTASQQAAESTTGGGRRSAARLAWLLAWLAFLPVVVFRAGLLVEGDTFVQIRIGQLIIAHHAIPAIDTFSWTMHGKPYFQNSWGFDVLLAIGYRLAGLPGAAWLCALITMGIAALVLALARSLGALPTAAAAALFVAAAPLTIWLTARPQLVDYAAVLALAMLLRAIERGRGTWGAVALVGVLTVTWINLHAAALVAVVIAAASAVLLAVTRRGAGWRYAAAAAAATVVACLANPYGIGVLHQAVQGRDAAVGSISEWMPLYWASPAQDITMAGGVAALVIAWRRREAVLTAALAVCIAGSVAAWRMLPFVVVLATPVLAAFASDPPDSVRRYLVSRRTMLQRGAALALAALVVVAAPSLTHIGRPQPSAYPVALVSDIPHGCRLFSTDVIGSYVILARPDVLVSLDTRNNLYGSALSMAENRVLQGYGDVSRGLAGAGCVLVPRSYGLARRLQQDRQWVVRAANQTAVLYVRR
jgi:hypothetical protein